MAVMKSILACFAVPQPLLSSEEMDKTKTVVAEFGKPGGVGEQLQQKLIERAKANDNWVSKYLD